MTPQEDDILHYLGTLFLVQVGSIGALTVLHGLFILLFAISTSITLRRGLSSRPAWALFIVSSISFCLGTISWIAQIAEFTIALRTILVANPGVPLLSRSRLASRKAFKTSNISGWITQIQPILSDAVVIWRAWVLFPEKRWLMIAPVALFLGAFATILPYYVASFNYATFIRSATTSPTISNLLTATLALSFATNASATLLIGFKLWSHRAFVNQNLGKGQRVTQAQRILYLLVESGAVYCVFQLVIVVLHNPLSPTYSFYFASKVFINVCSEISAMYPAIVAVLVNTQRSFLNNYSFSIDIETNGVQSHANARSRPDGTEAFVFATRPHVDSTGDSVAQASLPGRSDLESAHDGFGMIEGLGSARAAMRQTTSAP